MRFTRKLHIAKGTKPPGKQLAGIISFQTCDHSNCLPAAELDFAINL